MASEDGSGEDKLIARYFKPLARHPGALGLTDDAAVIAPPAGCDLVLTVDAIVSDVHFFRNDPPASVAQKALRVNLSDLAAKGAAPLGFLLTLGLPADIDEAWLKSFAEGLDQDIERFGCPLLGGDTVMSPNSIVVSVTAFGTVPHGTMLRRSGAMEGHRILVSGTIGDAALGLQLRKTSIVATQWRLDRVGRAHLENRYLVPEPRNAVAELVRRHASAAMDVSDGLVGDLTKLCRASLVSAEVAVERVPLSLAARGVLGLDPRLIDLVLTGGDDYEILAAVPDGEVVALQTSARALDVIFTDIGRFLPGDGEPRFMHNGRKLNFIRGSFSHF